MDFTEQELLIDRLDNWGRVYGERRPPGWRSSPLGVLREVGYQQEVPSEPAQPRADMADAAVVNAAWVAMRQSREKVFLRDTFMHPGRPRGCVCRGIGLKGASLSGHACALAQCDSGTAQNRLYCCQQLARRRSGPPEPSCTRKKREARSAMTGLFDALNKRRYTSILTKCAWVCIISSVDNTQEPNHG